jgi:hypothetical protein
MGQLIIGGLSIHSRHIYGLTCQAFILSSVSAVSYALGQGRGDTSDKADAVPALPELMHHEQSLNT